MEPISKAQIVKIKTMFRSQGVVEPDTIVRGYSNMRTGKVSELTKDEATVLIREQEKQDANYKASERMRRKIISMAYVRAGLPNNASKDQKLAVVKWVDGWCVQYGHKHKVLNSYTYAELPKLVSQFEAVINSLLIEI